MRHTLLLATLALAALLVATPLAAAQMPASVVVTLEPIDEPIVQGQAAVLKGTVRYVSDASAYANTIGIPVQYTIKSSPGWATVVLTPSSDTLVMGHPNGPTAEARGHFTALVIAAHDAAVHKPAMLEVVATAYKGTFTSAARGTGSVAVSAAEAPDPCAEGAVVAQGAGAALVPTSGGALVLGAMGALVGVVVGLAAFAATRRARLPRASALLLVLAAFALFAPSASAVGQSSATLMVHPDAAPVEPGEQVVLKGVLTLVADATAAAELSGMRVHYEIKHSPEWATVVLTPADDVIHFSSVPGPVQTAYTTFRVTVIPDAHMTQSEVGLVEVVASVRGQFHATSATGAVPVLVEVPPVCEPVAATPVETLDDAQDTQADASQDDDLSVQSAAPAAPLPVAPLLVGCAIAGALAGLVVARRLR